MTLPNFLIVGAPKSGTTALYRYLRAHPDVFMPETKEPRFFIADEILTFTGPTQAMYTARLVTSPAKYEELFAPVTTQRAIGEASTMYLYVRGAEHQIHRNLPKVKLIAILRNPVDRAYSNFLQQRSLGFEPLSDFARALQAEPARINDGWPPPWHYGEVGRYHSQLERFYRVFDRRQLRVYLHDDFEKDRLALVRDVLRFLEVDDAVVPDVSRRHNESRLIRSRALDRFVRGKNPLKDVLRPYVPDAVRQFLIDRERRWNHHRPPLDPALRRKLLEERREEIERLATLLDRDLSGWFVPRAPR